MHMYKLLQSLVAAGAAVLAAGCATHEMAKQPRSAMPVPAGFEIHEKARTPLEEIGRETLEKKRGYTHEIISFRVRESFETRTNLVEWYLPRASSRLTIPSLVVLPILGGKRYSLEQHFAESYARHGYAVALTHRPPVKDEVQAIDDIDRLLKESILDVQRTFDWMVRQPRIDANRLGLFGISFGAIRGSLAVALEPRVNAAVLGLGGGDLPYILAHTTEKGLIKYRDRVLEKQSLSPSEGEQILRGFITYEPLVLAQAVDPKKVFMVQATRDSVVPARTGGALWEMMGRPKRMSVFAGHYSALLYVPCIKAATLDFFEEKLGH